MPPRSSTSRRATRAGALLPTAALRIPGALPGVGGGGGEVLGWENIELISDRPFDVWIKEFKQVKDKYPDRVLIASIMEEYNKDAWVEVIERCEAAGVDAFELNFSCPHGLPERKMGSAMGQDPEILHEVCGWASAAATKPVWAKMTPNITHIEEAGRAALAAGIDGLSAINTILCVMGVNLDTLRPEPTVEGYTTPGGYSCKAVRPIALRMVMELAQMIRKDFANSARISGSHSPSLSGRGAGGGYSAQTATRAAPHRQPFPKVDQQNLAASQRPGTPPTPSPSLEGGGVFALRHRRHRNRR